MLQKLCCISWRDDTVRKTRVWWLELTEATQVKPSTGLYDAMFRYVAARYPWGIGYCRLVLLQRMPFNTIDLNLPVASYNHIQHFPPVPLWRIFKTEWSLEVIHLSRHNPSLCNNTISCVMDSAFLRRKDGLLEERGRKRPGRVQRPFLPVALSDWRRSWGGGGL
jgi:hypothetical protein